MGPLAGVIMGDVYPGKEGQPKNLQVKPIGGVKLSNIIIKHYALDQSQVHDDSEEDSPDSYKYIKISTDNKTYKSLLTTNQTDFYLKAIIPANAVKGKYQCGLTVTATINDTDEDTEVITLHGSVYWDYPKAIRGLSAVVGSSIFDKIIGFNKESDSDGTSTFQANIVMKEAAYISTGELISFYKDVGSLKRIYTGVIDNVASTEKAGIYTYQVSGKEDENNPI